MIGGEDIYLTVGHEVIHLRPTLRAAVRLLRKYGDLASLAAKLDELSFAAVSDVIRECSTTRSDLVALLDDGQIPLGVCLSSFETQMVQIVPGLVGVDVPSVDPDKRPSSGTAVPPLDYLQSLFGLATGVIGWSPETAWQATPAEIAVAYQARIDLLSAIFGGSKEADDAPSGDPMAARLDADGLAAIANIGRAL